MAKRTIQIPVFGGLVVNAREEDFEVVKEEWSEYRLLDGGKVRIRATANKIFRVVDAEGKPAYLPDGSPNVVVNQNLTIAASE